MVNKRLGLVPGISGREQRFSKSRTARTKSSNCGGLVTEGPSWGNCFSRCCSPFLVIIDRRDSTWHSVRRALSLLNDTTSETGLALKTVLVIRPRLSSKCFFSRPLIGQPITINLKLFQSGFQAVLSEATFRLTDYGYDTGIKVITSHEHLGKFSKPSDSSKFLGFFFKFFEKFHF